MTTWVAGFENSLARSKRPGYPSQNVSVNDVDKWIEQVKGMGVQSIICLLTNHQLSYYAQLPKGLLDYYRKRNFRVEHIPITDPAEDPVLGQQELNDNLEPVYRAYLLLPKPVLIHCSAGIDRTGAAVNYIQKRWREEKEQSAN
jgi:protein-tyrosine phosphatase